MIGKRSGAVRAARARGAAVARRGGGGLGGLLVVLAVLLAAAGDARAQAQARDGEPAFLSVGLGYYDVLQDKNSAELRAEYRGAEDEKLWIFTPFVGFSATTDAATYGYFGLGIDLFFGRRWVVTPNGAFGAYGSGNGPDLGHIVEFRTGVEIAYRFDNRARLGVSFHHLSNADLNAKKNGGTETLAIVYSLPIGSLFGD